MADSQTLERVRAWPRVPPLNKHLEWLPGSEPSSVRLFDPSTGRLLELNGFECELAQKLDGRSSLAELVALAQRTDPAIDESHVEPLIANLAELGFLEPDEFEAFREDVERSASAQLPAAEPPPETATPETVASEEQRAWEETQARVPLWKRTWLRVLVVVAIVVTAAALIEYPLHVTAEAAIVPAERAYVRAPMAGVIADILVDEGAVVHKGDVLARLDDRDLASDQRKATAQVERIQAELERLRHGARPEEISQQRSVVIARRTAVAYASKELARRGQMLADGVGAKHAVEEAELDLHIKQSALAEADAALRLLVAGSRPEEIVAEEAALKQAKAELELIDQKLKDMAVIRAPRDGVLLTPKFRERLGERVEAGGLVCEIANIATMHAEIFVPEREADTVALGMPVVVKVESYPLHPFDGKVDFIAPAVEVHDKANAIRVVANLDNHEGLLRQDMTGYGEVDCGKRTLLDLATRRVLRWIRVRLLI